MESKHPDQKYYELAEKWLNGSITPEEEKAFAEWYNKDHEAPLEIPTSFAPNEAALKQRIWAQVQKRRQGGRVIGMRLVRYSAAAALVLLVAGAAWLGWFRADVPVGVADAPPVSAPVSPDIQPGTQKAVLTLADGTQISLDDAADGELGRQGTTKVIKLDSGQLAYQAGGPAQGVSYNTLATPRGGQYEITLPDGTKVWLNASSSLRFPTAFTGKERTVELQGEAYFEVARNAAKPFTVKVNDMEVAVLGTHFNVMAYEGEGAAKTTLVEGSVKVKKGGEGVVIAPGQQAQVSAGGPLRVVKDANLEEVLAWKNGHFVFDGADIGSVMRQIERWYDVDIVYKGTVEAHFHGIIARNVPISKVFKMLELTGAVHFRMEDRKVIVSP